MVNTSACSIVGNVQSLGQAPVFLRNHITRVVGGERTYKVIHAYPDGAGASASAATSVMKSNGQQNPQTAIAAVAYCPILET